MRVNKTVLKGKLDKEAILWARRIYLPSVYLAGKFISAQSSLLIHALQFCAFFLFWYEKYQHYLMGSVFLANNVSLLYKFIIKIIQFRNLNLEVIFTKKYLIKGLLVNQIHQIMICSSWICYLIFTSTVLYIFYNLFTKHDVVSNVYK